MKNVTKLNPPKIIIHVFILSFTRDDTNLILISYHPSTSFNLFKLLLSNYFYPKLLTISLNFVYFVLKITLNLKQIELRKMYLSLVLDGND